MAPVPLAARVVEVIADLGESAAGRYRYGSGFIVRGGTVLTAAHVVAGAVSVSVRDPDKKVFSASWDPRFTGDPGGPGPDLALVEVHDAELDLPPVGLARIDRDSPTGDPVRGCRVIGYPAFMEQETPGGGQVRETADASGHVPVLSRLAGGLLSVQVTQAPRPLPPGEAALGESEWSGMSGAPVLAGGLLLGVVCEHAAREGSSAVTATPLTALEADPAHPGWGPGVADPGAWWARLGVPGIASLQRLPARRDHAGQPRGHATAAGRPLDEMRDPFTLEVHRPVQPDGAPAGLPVLPPYVPREHDQALERVVRAAAEGGRSGVAVLVGGSSTGKTRACWEALDLLRQAGGWRLWHPIDPGRPEALLAGLAGVGPRTVVWLNEAQFYLDPPEARVGERVAAGLRELLRDPARAPVLVLATLWPQFWAELTARLTSSADPHGQVRDLLGGQEITVPAAFTRAQMSSLERAGDARLALAAKSAPDGEVTQFLAGVPALLARYRNAPPAARAVITAAMDARRLGAGLALPPAFLEAAAPAYLTDAEWDGLGEDWAEQALAYAAVPCKGTRGPLARIRPRPAGSAAPSGSGPACRLADYLDQHGRASRSGLIPLSGFWAAAAAHASPQDQAALGDAADDRGLYRAAAQLHKNAAAAGIISSARYLAQPPDCLQGDPRPASWAAAHANLSNPSEVAVLLDSLREAGALEQAAALLARDPAAYVDASDPDRVAWLLGSLRAAGAHGQAAALAARAAAEADLSNPHEVAALLDSLRAAGAHEQAAALLARDPAAEAGLSNPYGVARLLDSLREAGAHEQAAALLARDPAAHVDASDPNRVAWLLGILRAAGAHEQAAALAVRAAAEADLGNSAGVTRLLGTLRRAGAHEQAAALAARAAAKAGVNNPYRVTRLLGSLRAAGAHRQAAALAARAAAEADLGNPYRVALLLGGLREAGARKQAAALLARDPAAHADLGDPYGVARLLDSLRGAGARQQAGALLARDPAGHADVGDPLGVAYLLDSLREASAHEQAAALAARAAAEADLGNPAGAAGLLDSLGRAGAHEQVAALLARDPAAYADLGDSNGVARLLGTLRRAGAHEQAAALAGRLPGAGMFGAFLEELGPGGGFRFGREADGTPARAWGWDDLDLRAIGGRGGGGPGRGMWCWGVAGVVEVCP